MTNTKNTKRALLSSVLALFLCFAMLLGTTYAWFTDSVTSAGNKIVAGTLDVDLYLWKSTTESVEITNDSAPIFGDNSHVAQNNAANTIWEPGKTQVVYLSIKNNGTLDLKYKVAIEVTDVEKNIIDVLYYTITPDEKWSETPVTWDDAIAEKVVEGTNVNTEDVPLKASEEHFFALSVHMDEEAGNEYQGASVTFDIKVLATQLSSESDSFGNTYDSAADYPNVSNTVALDTTSADGVQLATTGTNEVTANISATLVQSLASAGVESIALCHSVPEFDTATGVVTFDSVEIVDQDGKIIDLANFEGTLTITLPVNGIEDGTVVTVYHDGVVITDNASVHNGTISYTTEHLCKIEIKKSELKMPTATVTELGAQTVYTDNGNVQFPLEYVLQFSTTDTAETIENSPYKYWNADFVVSFDKDVAMGSAALVGYYPEWDENYWYGMNIPEEGLKAGEGFRVLSELFEQFPTFGNSDCVSYEYVVNMVKDFKCGVADFEKYLDANGVSEEDRNGATYGLEDGTVITVELRLYETTPVEIEKPDGSGGTIIQYQETGDSYVICTYVYTYNAN